MEAPKIGSVILTPTQMCGNSRENPWEWMNPLLWDPLKSSPLLPRPSSRALAPICYSLSLQWVQPPMLESSLISCFPNAAAALWASAEQETCTSSVPPASWARRMETGLSVTQGEGVALGGAAVPPRGLWCLSSWFHSLFMTFPKVLWAPKIVSTISLFSLKF